MINKKNTVNSCVLFFYFSLSVFQKIYSYNDKLNFPFGCLFMLEKLVDHLRMFTICEKRSIWNF